MANAPPPGTSPPRHGGKPKKPSPKAQFLWAEGQQESGGNYKIVNDGSGALGRWQVMPANLPGWLKESGLPPMTDQQYLDDPKAQNTLAWHILGGDYDKYGARGAAAVWYSGQPDWHATYGDPPVYQYVDDVIRLMGGAPDISGLGPGLTYTGTEGKQNVALGAVPKPGREDWSAQVKTTSQHFASGTGALLGHRKVIESYKLLTGV